MQNYGVPRLVGSEARFRSEPMNGQFESNSMVATKKNSKIDSFGLFDWRILMRPASYILYFARTVMTLIIVVGFTVSIAALAGGHKSVPAAELVDA